MKFSFFGSSLIAADWNGAATYVRGILRALHARGHHVTYYEPQPCDRVKPRDIGAPSWSEVVVYEPTQQGAAAALRRAADCDVLVAASGVGVLDEFLESAVLEYVRDTRVVYWDLNPSATLERLRTDWRDPFHELVGAYDAVFTFGGGPSVVEAYLRFGARACVPIHNAVDPDTHRRAAEDERAAGDHGTRAAHFGVAAHERSGADHTYTRRARDVERALERTDNVRSVRYAYA